MSLMHQMNVIFQVENKTSHGDHHIQMEHNIGFATSREGYDIPEPFDRNLKSEFVPIPREHKGELKLRDWTLVYESRFVPYNRKQVNKNRIAMRCLRKLSESRLSAI